MKVKTKWGITAKLFVITMLMFGVFLASTLVIQSLFFERLYLDKKQSDMKSNIKAFEVAYKKALDPDKKDLIIEQYERNYNINIIVRSSNGKLNTTRVISNKLDSMKYKNDLRLFINAWLNDPENMELLKRNNKPVSIIPRREKDDPGELIGIVYSKQKSEIIFAISSLQPVNEAVGVIKSLYLYFCIGAIFIIIILALIYSNMIAKPLLKISKVATRVAGLDFKEKCPVNSDDEIGIVASSLNFLSENLDNALTSLREANSKLEQDIEKERRLEKTRKEFVAAVSHELKTPISLIDGYAVGLKDKIFEGEDNDYYLDIIIDESRKMSNLVSEMLDLSYLESGTFKLVPEEFNLTDLIEFTIKKYETVIIEKNVNVELRILHSIPIFADYNRMEQVLTNFITNALKNINEKGILYINTVAKKDSVLIEIENSGSHIAEDEIVKVWNQFYKGDKSRSRKLGGTGIGLSIVKNILTLHKFPFGVKNTDIGVKFYFEIPKHTIDYEWVYLKK